MTNDDRLGGYRSPDSAKDTSEELLPGYNEVKKPSTPFIFTQNPPPVALTPGDTLTAERQQRIVDAFRHAWKGYATDAFGRDEYQPLSHSGHDWAPGGIGLMIVDALDTIQLMNLEEEYKQARQWVATKLNFDKQQHVNLFETTIRVLGGLLSAYHLSDNDPIYLEKAKDLGNRLMGAFDSDSGIPYPMVTLSTGMAYKFESTSSTAETATVQLEFKYLSHLTGDPKYKDAAVRVMKKYDELIQANKTVDGLVPIFVNPVSGSFVGQLIRLGSRGDSYYEYLLKQFLQTQKTEKRYRELYDHAVQGIKKHLIAKSYPNQLTYIGELLHGDPTDLSPKMDHLVCFMGGSFALGATEGLTIVQNPPANDQDKDDLELGKEITRTCYEMYNLTETGLASEIVYFNANSDSAADAPDMTIQRLDRHNLLRPETLESIFLLWRITGDQVYREWGWQIFEAFEKYTKLSGGGYAALKDVTQIPPIQDDRMDTFFLAETLKYLYLLFSPDDLVPLDKYVFNTEAHPLPMFTPTWE
ncbi:mannosyl-oligosaccharide alpha-1,2-mannosidase [Apophysomyces sp. BC1034]|nr:mannosyl-oligosaccharide alpha-1,2-mannosidase [Apophysomyces sp. BC1015]KAG0180004.1 mannosyl-oligosaccharide alpha-1,2-mannosidase [Apophysomyces sp. BC1021]KAG0193510.1 mannosyl-oligosaccharide alpha-1,2-mannosidase [Apophysomyces sp. BC1034]